LAFVAQVRPHDDQDAPLSLGPALGQQNQPGLDRLAEADLIREQRGDHRSRELLQAVRGTALGQLVSKLIRVVVTQLHVSAASSRDQDATT